MSSTLSSTEPVWQSIVSGAAEIALTIAVAACGGGGDAPQVAPDAVSQPAPDAIISSQIVRTGASATFVAPAKGSVSVAVSADLGFTNGSGTPLMVDIGVGARFDGVPALYTNVFQRVTAPVAAGAAWSQTARTSNIVRGLPAPGMSPVVSSSLTTQPTPPYLGRVCAIVGTPSFTHPDHPSTRRVCLCVIGSLPGRAVCGKAARTDL
jgi:hypothetical protein